MTDKIKAKLTIPSWQDVMNKAGRHERLNPLEQFVFDNEPSGDDEYEFFDQLQDALEFIYDKGQRDLVAGMEPDAYSITQPDGRTWIYTTRQTDQEYLDRMRGKGYTVRALAFVPEVES